MAFRFQYGGVDLGQSPLANQWVERITGRPAWVWKLSATLAGLVLLVPLLALLLAVVMAGIVFLLALYLLTLLANVLKMFGFGASASRDLDKPHDQFEDPMRDNVRVIDGDRE